MIPPYVVANCDYAVLAIAGFVALVCLLVAAYIVPWTAVARQQLFTREFNYLWVTRCCLQVLAACYALALLLRLQVLWSADSFLFTGGFHIDTMCRIYIGVSFGLLEPAFVLIVLFSCMYTLNNGQFSLGSSPNSNIFFRTVMLTLPMCVLQIFAALFSRIITQLPYHQPLLKKFFAASVPVPGLCPDDDLNPNCAACVFPEFSTLISAAFAVLYLLAFWYISGRVARTAINKWLARRIRSLELAVTVFFCASVVLRGITVLFVPYTVAFEATYLAFVACVVGQIVSASFVLVWKPVYDGREADQRITSTSLVALSLSLSTLPGGSSSANAGAAELLPLVQFKHDSLEDAQDLAMLAATSGRSGPGAGQLLGSFSSGKSS